MNILRNDIDAMWDTMEVSKYSDEVMNNLVKIQAKELKDKLQQLNKIAKDLREVVFSVPAEVNESVNSLGIGGPRNIEDLINKLSEVQGDIEKEKEEESKILLQQQRAEIEFIVDKNIDLRSIKNDLQQHDQVTKKLQKALAE